MNKPKLLYASPFPPLRSGISDYSVSLLNAIDEYFDITLYTDDYMLTEPSLDAYPVLKYRKDLVDHDKFDYCIYNIGNNPEYHSYIYETAIQHPGLIILHDIVLYYLFVGYYQRKGTIYSATYSKLGFEDFLQIKDAVKKYGPDLLSQKHMAARLYMNRELLGSGNRFMVHSEYAKNNVLATGLIGEDKVSHINLISQIETDEKLIDRSILLRKYRVPENALIIASFGYIADTKFNIEICRAVKSLSKKFDRKLCYVMVGEGNYADAELESGQIIKTGFTKLDEFNSFIAYSDIAVNLRYPPMGETSAAMMRILQLGKPCVTNNGGWFSEIPDNVVYKIELDSIEKNLEEALSELMSRPDIQESVGKAAKKYIMNEYNKEKIAQQIYDFVTA